MALENEDYYDGTQTYSSFWEGYSKYRGEAQAPASQALLAGLTGFVAEAAVPRFVTKSGQKNSARSWNLLDLMVDIDDNKTTYEESTQTQNRQNGVPNSGIRDTYGEMVFSSKCPLYGGNDDDRSLIAYTHCAVELTPIEFRFNGNEPIELYINHPSQIYSFIETCEISGSLRCWTDMLEPGLDYLF